MISELHAARARMLAGNAQDALEQLARFEGEFASLALVRGECQYVLGHWREAVREFERTLRLAPNSPRAAILLELAGEMLELSNLMRPAASPETLLPATLLPPTQLPASEPAPPLRLNNSIEQTEAAPAEPLDEIGLVSETLAELMTRQGKIEEARKVYIQLSRLNPDRYDYFKERIEALRPRSV